MGTTTIHETTIDIEHNDLLTFKDLLPGECFITRAYPDRSNVYIKFYADSKIDANCVNMNSLSITKILDEDTVVYRVHCSIEITILGK